MTAKEYQDAIDKATAANEAAKSEYYTRYGGIGIPQHQAFLEAENAYRETQRGLSKAQEQQKQYQELIGQFKESLGREAKPEELDYFLKFINEGQLQPYEVGQILKSTPEHQQSLQKKQYEELQGQLGQYDTQLLQQAQGQLTGQYRQMGRPFTSAYDNAFAQAAQQLAMNRQPFLTQYLAGGQGDLRSQYLGAGQQAISRGYGLRDEARQRQFALEDYYRQQNYYNDLINQQNRFQRNQFIGAGIGALAGMGLGYAIPGIGAQAGAQAGGLFGRGAGSLY